MAEVKNTSEPANKPASANDALNLSDLHDKTPILVVDDEKLIRLTICAKLKSAGYAPVAVETVDEAVKLLKRNRHLFSAVISDIMMGNMDGFVFRDIVRGIDKSMPFFFMTALDPEEGSGFLKRIVSDPLSYYLPKSVGTDVMLNRVQRVVASRRVERFIERQVEEGRQSLKLAAHIQRSMLPPRAYLDDKLFYAIWWKPKDIVSGDVYDAIPLGDGRMMYVLGDIQGHGTSAALVMTAVQSFLKNIDENPDKVIITPAKVARLLHRFFRTNLPDVSYMTALICIHDPNKKEVSWISCGAPDLLIADGTGENAGGAADAIGRTDPSRKGGLPIGLLHDTEYREEDVVVNKLVDTAVCIATTDGLYDRTRDEDGFETIPFELQHKLRCELVKDARMRCSETIEAHKYIKACEEYGFIYNQDDETILLFGPTLHINGVFEATVPLSPTAIDEAARKIGAWCRSENWTDEDIGLVELVLEEKLMNVYDHGFDDVDKLNEVASVRLVKRRNDDAELTVWDCGTPEPSIAVAGDSDTAFELANRKMQGHGRGRLIVRGLCNGIERKRYGELNETVYHIRLEHPAKEGNKQ